MNQDLIKEKLVSRFGADVIQSAMEFQGQVSVAVPPEKIIEISAFMKDDPDLSFDFLTFVAGVDRHPNAPRFELVYQLYSTKHNHRFRMKSHLAEPRHGQAMADSVVSVWPTANWHERETAEMFGISFKGHPDPRKLLLPEHWKVYPLRKDFPLEGTDETSDLPVPGAGGKE